MATVMLSIPKAVPGFQFMIYWFVMLSLLIKSSETINCSEPTADALLNALKQSIFNKSEVRPVIRPHTPTNISVGFTLLGILDMDEKAQIFDSFLWLYIFWHFEGLSWDPIECGTDRIALPRKKLWMPDIVINEFMDKNKAPDTYYLYILNTGSVMDDRPFRVVCSCNLDIYTFPFDIQNCSFTFSSYKLYATDVRLSFAHTAKVTLKNSLDAIKTKGEWELVNMMTEKPALKSINSSADLIVFHIILRRRASLYVVNLLIPSCFLITVDLFSFLLPPQSTDRSAFKMTLILGYTVFLLLMNDLLPATGNTLPLINVFFSLCFALMVGSLLETIIITNILCGSSHYPPLPQWARVFFLQCLAKLVCLSQKPSDQTCAPQVYRIESHRWDPAVKIPQSEADKKTLPAVQELRKISQDLQCIVQEIDKQCNSDQSTDEWMLLGQVIDRFLFALYVIFFLVSFIAILVCWLYWYNTHASLI